MRSAVRHARGGLILAIGFALACPASAAPSGQGAPAAARSAVSIAINGKPLAPEVMSAFIAPDTAIRISASGASAGAGLALSSADAALSLRRISRNRWRIAPPAHPGIYTVTLKTGKAAAARRINLFVMQHFDPHNDSIDGYRIGHYRLKPLKGRAIYDPPTALMPITKAEQGVHLSQHFTIGQFLCGGQAGKWPKFLIVREKLVAKLEAVLAALNERGIHARTLHVLSGYRTPAYNAAIGNTTVYSRHLYGGAADIYVDTDHNGRMDDLNGDGQINKADAQWLAALIAKLDKTHPAFVGGLSAYPGNAAHGPFVHTDVRGVAVRW